jgi:anti-sigma factor RsiW
MNCKAVQTRLSAYLDRELTGTELLQLREHLRDCTECRAEECQLRELKSVLGGLKVPEPTADFADRLCATVIKSAPVADRKPTWRRPFFTFGAVAACSMALTFALVTPRQSTPTAKAPVKNDVKYDLMQDEAYAIGSNATEGAPVVSVSGYGR